MIHGPRIDYIPPKVDWAGNTLYAFECVNLCHGFGRCSYCDGSAIIWTTSDEYEGKHRKYEFGSRA